MIVHSHSPYNAEPTPARLCAAFFTPQQDFYIRTHGSVPLLDGARHRLLVDGLVATPLDLSVPELARRFEPRSVTAVMQCAGNRRADLQPVRPTSGDPWGVGAIGNAVWGGVALADVLRAAGVQRRTGLHVAFAACDDIELPDEGRFRYGVSIPLDKALCEDVLLATAMNGEALTPAHGFPLRVVVPGYAGVRSPKWLARITVQDAPSDNHMQQRDYKLLPADIVEATPDWSRGLTIDEMPLTSAICEPEPGARLPPGQAVLRGYATAGSRPVARVDVSADGGATWQQAELQRDANAPWSWALWQASVALQPGLHELVVRAWDTAGQAQPERAETVWNVKGYLSTAWHRVRVQAV